MTRKRQANGLSLVSRNKDFGVLWCGRLVSNFGDRLEIVAVPWLIYDMTGSAKGVALWYISISLPSVLFGSVVGVLIDRFDRQRVMIVSDLIRGVLVCIVPFAQTPFQVYAVAFAISFFYAIFGPAMEAVLPDIIKNEDDLIVANSLTAAANSAAVALGPAIGGLIIARMGLAAAFFLDALSFFLSAIAIWVMKIPQVEKHEKTRSRFRRDWLDGFIFMRKHPTTLLLILITALSMAVIGVHGSLLVVFARESLRVGGEGYGYLAGAIGIGTLVGSLGLGAFGSRKRKSHLVQIGLLFCGILLVLFGFTTTLWLAVIIRFAYGLGDTLYRTPASTMLQEEVPSQLRGRILSIGTALRDSALLLSSALAGLLADSLGANRIFMGVGLVLLSIGTVGGQVLKWATRDKSRQVTI
jgi:DHA3 family macrolide efflux protein-like MFS transporter